MTPTQNSPGFYGWTVAIALWFTYLLSTGLPFYGASVVNAAMGKTLQLDKTTVGMGFSMLSLVWGFSGPLTAFLLNRIGLRATVTIGTSIVAVGAFVLALLVSTGWMYVFAYGIVIGVGVGLASNLPTQTGITLWFNKKRALVLSLVMTASGVGGFFAPPLLNRIISFGDWRSAWLFIGTTSLIAAAIAAIFLRNKPADLGQWPDGIVPEAGAPTAHAGTIWTPREIFRRRAFWQILVAGIVFGAPAPLLVAHSVNHLEGLGHPPAVAAWALGLMLLFSVPGRVVGGFLCDRFDPRFVWSAMMLLITAGVAIITVATTTTHIVLFAGLMGIGFGASIICWVSMTAKYFGPASFATVMGMQTPISTLVVSSVPTLAGMLYDRVGNFSLALWSVTLAVLLGALMITVARVPQHPSAIPVTAV